MPAYLDKIANQGTMLRIIKALYLIIGLLREILAELRNREPVQTTGDPADRLRTDLIDNTDLKAILKISDRTLFRLKKEKAITPIRIGTRDYYSVDDIRLLRQERG